MPSFVQWPIQYPRGVLNQALEDQIEKDRKELFELQVRLQALQNTQIRYKERTLARFKSLVQHQGNMEAVNKEWYVYQVVFTHLSKEIEKVKAKIGKIRSRKYKCWLTGELYSPW